MKGRRVPRRACNPPPPSGLEACEIQAQFCNLQDSSEINVPPARRSRQPTVFPPLLHRLFCRLWLPSYVFYGISCLGGAQNSNSGRIRAQILKTLCKLRSPGAQNSNSGHLRAQILDALCKLHSPSAQINQLTSSCNCNRPNRQTDLLSKTSRWRR